MTYAWFVNEKIVNAMDDIIIENRYQQFNDVTLPDIIALIKVCFTQMNEEDIFTIVQDNTKNFIGELSKSFTSKKPKEFVLKIHEGIVEYFTPYFEELFHDCLSRIDEELKIEGGYRKSQDNQTGETIWIK